jgi:uncharacterized membrane protein
MKQIQIIWNNIYTFCKHILEWFNRIYDSKFLVWSVIAVGIFLRIARWSQNFSLWLDEAMITLNIVDRNFLELTHPLDHFQEAPVGFLFVEKVFTIIFGESELVLRLFPLLASIAALLLFYKVAKSCLSKKAVSVAMVFFVISPELIHYSAIVKPYSCDVLACVIILFVATILFKDKVSTNEMILSLLTVLFIPYFSYTSIFVICGLIAGLFIKTLVRRRKKDLLPLIYVGISFLISIAVFYLLIIRYKDNSALDVYWQKSFLPFPPKNFSELSYVINEICSVFKNPLHLTTFVFNTKINKILGVIVLIGISIACVKKRYVHAAIFVVTLCAILIASGLKQYPFAPRLILCLIPLFLLFLSEGLAFICCKSYMTPILVIVSILLTRFQWHDGFYKTIHERSREDIRPMIEYILENKTDGDKIYVYFRTKFAFKYYAKRFDISENDYCIGVDYSVGDETYMTDLENLQGADDVWIVMSHYKNKPEYLNPILGELKKCGVRQDVHYHESRDAQMYMYKISQ